MNARWVPGRAARCGLGRRVLRFCGWAPALGLVLASGRAAAQEGVLPEASYTFEYRTPREKYYLRPILEELGLLGLGLAYYFQQHEANAVDWDLDYSWDSFEQKLDGRAYAFDTNHFNTNFVTHPVAGMLYYLAARGNRLSVLESLGYSFASSTLWEFLGEFRERVSVNDLFTTPLTGFILGEATTQLGAFFDRSCPTDANRILGSVFAPSKSVHDAIDGVSPRRDRICDKRGLSAIGGHRFDLSVSEAVVWRDTAARDDPPTGELRGTLRAEIKHFETLGREGSGWLSFSDGNWALLSTELAGSKDGLTDFDLIAHSAPAGLHYRDLVGLRGGGVRGSEVVLGFLAGAEYNMHQYRASAAKPDRWFVLNVPAARIAWTLHRGRNGFDLQLDAGAALGAASTFALSNYLGEHTDAELPTVTRVQGYSYGLGFSLAPSAKLRLDGTEIGLDARSDRLFALRRLDRSPTANPRVGIAETRRLGRLWLTTGPDGAISRLIVTAEVLQRGGFVGETGANSLEFRLGTGLGLAL